MLADQVDAVGRAQSARIAAAELVEGADKLLKLTIDACEFCTRNGLRIMYVTEDTVRAHPDTLRRLFLTAIRAGAQRLCLHVLRIPPGGRAKAHLHASHETAIYLVAGTVRNAVLVLHGTTGSGAQFLRPDFAGELFGAGFGLLSRHRVFIE